MRLLSTVLLLSLHALVATVFFSRSYAGPSDVVKSDQQARIQLELEGFHNLSTRALGDTCGPVRGANVQGDCRNSQSTSNCCMGFYTRDLCPRDPPNVLCCTAYQRCSDGSGWCNDINHVSCSEPYDPANLCPGPANVQCCRGLAGLSTCTPGGPL